MSRRPFNRYMVEIGMGTNAKLADLNDSEFRAHVVGVLSVAASSPVRGCLLVGQLPAKASHIARAAGVSPKVAASAMAKLEELGVLEADPEHGCLRVHDWDDYNPPPKADKTAAERKRRQRERECHAYVTPQSRRDIGDVTALVTPPEVEVEVEVEGEVEDLQAEALPLPPEEARPSAALSLNELHAIFFRWRDRCRQGSRQIQLTEQREKALRSRRSRDGFTVDELNEAIDGAAAAIEADELDHEHHWTELYRIMVDAEHVNAWITYHRTGDYYVIQEALLTEQPRTAA